MNGLLAGDLAVIEELFESMESLLMPLDEREINWEPPAPNANSIADLTAHILGSIDAWLCRALDERFERDRDAEFESRADAAALLAAVTAARQRVRDQFAKLDGIDGAIERQIRRLDASADAPISVGWCIAHAIVHAGEHLGQIQLTRDLVTSPLET